MAGIRPLGTFPIGHDLYEAAAAGGGVTVSVPAGSLTLTGFAPTVSAPRTISVPAGSLTLTGFAPTVSTPRTISVPAGSLTLTGYAPTVTGGSSGTTVSVPAGSLTLTGFSPTVSVSAVIAIPAGALTLTGFAPSVFTTAGVVVDVPAGSLTLTGYAPTVYTLGGFTDSVMYLPIRAYANSEAGSVENTTLNTLKSLLPRQPQKVVQADGTMDPAWYRCFDYLINTYLGSLSQPTIESIVTAVEESMGATMAAAQTTALVAQQAQANAEALAATVEVLNTNSIAGASEIPRVSLSYLEP